MRRRLRLSSTEVLFPWWVSAVPREDAPYSLRDLTEMGHLVEHRCNLALDRV
jgi:hypothetical protein